MQMKNLLRLMGSLALSTGAITSVVACGQQAAVNLDTVLKEKQLGNVSVVDVAKPTVDEIKNAIKAVPANKEINLAGIKVKITDTNDSAVVSPDGTIYNGNDITVTFTLIHKKTDQDVITDITTALQQGVDGRNLNDSQKQSDAGVLIKAAMKLVTDQDQVGEATFTFEDGNKLLDTGENIFKIQVTFGESKDVLVNVKLTGVVHKKTDQDVITDITTALQQGVDGRNLNDSQKQSDAEVLIKAAMKLVTDQDQVGEATFTFEDGNKLLDTGENIFKIKVTFGESKDVLVDVKLTGVKSE